MLGNDSPKKLFRKAYYDRLTMENVDEFGNRQKVTRRKSDKRLRPAKVARWPGHD